MELGCDGVLLNTGIASARDPLTMASAMRLACVAGRKAFSRGSHSEKTLRDGEQPRSGNDRRRDRRSRRFAPPATTLCSSAQPATCAYYQGDNAPIQPGRAKVIERAVRLKR